MDHSESFWIFVVPPRFYSMKNHDLNEFSQLRMHANVDILHVTSSNNFFYFSRISFSRFVTLVSKDIIYLSIMSDNWYLSSLSNYNADVTPWRPAFESQIIIVWLSTDFFSRVWWVWQNTRRDEHSTANNILCLVKIRVLTIVWSSIVYS